MTYESDVQRGRELLKRGEEAQWALAELSWMVTQVAVEKVTQAQWARDIGTGTSHISSLVKVWNSWRGVDTRDRPAFHDAYLMADESAEPEAARQAVSDRRAQSAITKASPETRQKIAAVLIKDPEIRRHAINEFVRTREGEAEIEQARNHRYGWQEQEVKERALEDIVQQVARHISNTLAGDRLDTELRELKGLPLSEPQITEIGRELALLRHRAEEAFQTWADAFPPADVRRLA